ncbi:hypothetical protein SDC9_146615 [bioreactor metagenome]|uniref:Elongation factor SelB fourth winged-helix domain-containing protein n=2 Tax=root TaxID=1 RepID=A0A645EBK3_9ZZZZ
MDILINKLSNEKILKVNENLVSIYDFKVEFNNKQKEIKNNIKSILDKNGIETLLTIDDICNKNIYYEEVLEAMIGLDIEQLDEKYVISSNLYNKLKSEIIEYLKENTEITLGEYRDLLNSSRKNCMIILENFDRNKITKREDNKRILY